MDERVTRRGVFKKILSNGVDTVTRLLTEDPAGTSRRHDDISLSAEQAGHLLRSRKTFKSISGLNLKSPVKRPG